MFEISFDNPIYMWYLLSIPLLIYTHFYLFRHAKTKAMSFANFEALKRVTGEKLMTKNITILMIRILIIVCVIVAASGTTVWREGEVNDNDFIIALDNSASMAAQDILPTRLEAAKSTAINFVNSLKSTSNIGLLSFAGTTLVESVPINNKDSIAKTIENIETTKTGGTDIGGAIITGTNMLLTSQKGKIIILITDGSNTVGAFIADSINNSIEYASKSHVVVYTMGIGSDTGPIGYLPEYYNISAVYNEVALQQISNATHGKYYKALNSTDLEAAYKEISKDVSKGLIPMKLSYGLMLVALLLLFVEWGLISTRFRRIP